MARPSPTFSGKAAQFGRGVLADVSGKLIGQFAQRLEADLLAGGATPSASSATPGPAAAPAAFSAPRADDDAAADLNVLSLIAAPLAKRALPVAAGLLVGALLGWLLGGRSRGPRRPYILVLPSATGSPTH